MPTGPSHELLVELFRSEPTLAATLLDLLHADLPAFEQVEVADATLPTVDASPMRADLLLRLVHGGAVQSVVLVEIQRAPDEAKRYDWPAHVALAQRLHRCPAWLLVVTLDESVARWAARITAAGSLGHVARAAVLGPTAIPWLSDPRAAAERPEAAILSTLAHAADAGSKALAPIVLALLRSLDDARASIYADEILGAASGALMKQLDKAMLESYEFKSQYFRDRFAQAKAAGAAEGRLEGISLGISQGRAAETATNVLAVFEARGLAVSDELRARVLGCADLDQLGLWLRRAVTVVAPDDIFAPG